MELERPFTSVNVKGKCRIILLDEYFKTILRDMTLRSLAYQEQQYVGLPDVLFRIKHTSTLFENHKNVAFEFLHFGIFHQFLSFSN